MEIGSRVRALSDLEHKGIELCAREGDELVVRSRIGGYIGVANEHAPERTFFVMPNEIEIVPEPGRAAQCSDPGRAQLARGAAKTTAAVVDDKAVMGRHPHSNDPRGAGMQGSRRGRCGQAATTFST